MSNKTLTPKKKISGKSIPVFIFIAGNNKVLSRDIKKEDVKDQLVGLAESILARYSEREIKRDKKNIQPILDKIFDSSYSKSDIEDFFKKFHIALDTRQLMNSKSWYMVILKSIGRVYMYNINQDTINIDKKLNSVDYGDINLDSIRKIIRFSSLNRDSILYWENTKSDLIKKLFGIKKNKNFEYSSIIRINALQENLNVKFSMSPDQFHDLVNQKIIEKKNNSQIELHKLPLTIKNLQIENQTYDFSSWEDFKEDAIGMRDGLFLEGEKFSLDFDNWLEQNYVIDGALTEFIKSLQNFKVVEYREKLILEKDNKEYCEYIKEESEHGILIYSRSKNYFEFHKDFLEKLAQDIISSSLVISIFFLFIPYKKDTEFRLGKFKISNKLGLKKEENDVFVELSNDWRDLSLDNKKLRIFNQLELLKQSKFKIISKFANQIQFYFKKIENVEIFSQSLKNNQLKMISEQDFELLLQILHNFSISMQNRFYTYQSFEEENFRDLLLDNLNSFIKASAETKSRKGKTDIYIDAGKQNFYIGECKIWRGKKIFEEGSPPQNLGVIEQLFSYITDNIENVFLIIFIIGIQSPIKIIKKIKDILENREDFNSESSYSDEFLDKSKYLFHYQFIHPRDENRTIHVHLLNVILN